MNLLDRFLSVQPIAKRHLQLIGTVCMFIAAKLKSSSTHYSAETLVIYTDNSITIDQLLVCEQFVMQRLRWDVQSVLAVDILPHLFARLAASSLANNTDNNDYNYERLRSYVSNFICACATEYKFSMMPASMIASACLYLALRRLDMCADEQFADEKIALEDIHGLLGNSIDFECLVQCVQQIDAFLCAEFTMSSIASNLSSTTTTSNNLESQQEQHQHANLSVEVSSTC